MIPCKHCGSDRDAKGRCKPCSRKKKQAWREANREEARKRDKDWYWANLDAARARRRSRSPEEIKEYNRRNYERNYSTFLERNERRRKCYAGCVGFHTRAEWESLKAQFNFLCVRCYRRTTLTKDHIKPLSLGGTDFIQNIQPLCRSCNSSKKAKELDYAFWFMVA